MSFSLFDNGEFELESRFSPQRSFYNKATVVIDSDGGNRIDRNVAFVSDADCDVACQCRC